MSRGPGFKTWSSVNKTFLICNIFKKLSARIDCNYYVTGIFRCLWNLHSPLIHFERNNKKIGGKKMGGLRRKGRKIIKINEDDQKK